MTARYAATHSFPLVDPRHDRPIGSAMWGNAVLTREPLTDGFATGLPRAADDDLVEPTGADHPFAGVSYGATEPGHREPRCVVGGVTQRVAVATAHLTYIGRDQRRRQAEALRSVAAGFAAPVVLTGDFNAPLDAPELAGLGDGYVDAFAAAGVATGDPARASCGPSSIDHILVRGLTVESCRVVTEAGDASDHWPVVADLHVP
jgi:hypothetical protein